MASSIMPGRNEKIRQELGTFSEWAVFGQNELGSLADLYVAVCKTRKRNAINQVLPRPEVKENPCLLWSEKRKPRIVHSPTPV